MFEPTRIRPGNVSTFRLFAVPLLVVASVTTWFPEPSGSCTDKELSSTDVAKIKALCETFCSVWTSSDGKPVLKLLTKDAVLLPHHGVTPVVGLDAIEKFWFPPDSPPTVITKFVMTPGEVHGAGDFACVWGTFSLSYTTEGKDGKKNVSNAGTYMMVVRKQPNGAWLIARHMWDDPPARTQ